MLAVLAAALGAWMAPRVELDTPLLRAWCEGRPLGPGFRRVWAMAIAIGATASLVLIFAPRVAEATTQGLNIGGFAAPLATRLLYGGIVEELIMRWGLMSTLVWAAWRLSGGRRRIASWCYWLGAVLAAALFALGHLPALHLLVGRPEWPLVLLVLIGNFVPGVLFGWLFWRQGLEAAMIAHASAHLIAWTVLLAA